MIPDFCFDESLHPLRSSLASCLDCEGVPLEMFHVRHGSGSSKKEALAGLLDEKKRRLFQQVFDVFVRQVCLPQLEGLTECMFQAFPCVRILRPSEFSIGPHSDTSYGFVASQINFVVPLTDSNMASALYLESHPRAEDWHPLNLVPGSVKRFWGSCCLHFTSENTTDASRVSLDFRVLPMQFFDPQHDQYTKRPGYYVHAKLGDNGKWERMQELCDTDNRNGFPFV